MGEGGGDGGRVGGDRLRREGKGKVEGEVTGGERRSGGRGRSGELGGGGRIKRGRGGGCRWGGGGRGKGEEGVAGGWRKREGDGKRQKEIVATVASVWHPSYSTSNEGLRSLRET